MPYQVVGMHLLNGSVFPKYLVADDLNCRHFRILNFDIEGDQFEL